MLSISALFSNETTVNHIRWKKSPLTLPSPSLNLSSRPPDATIENLSKVEGWVLQVTVIDLCSVSHSLCHDQENREAKVANALKATLTRS